MAGDFQQKELSGSVFPNSRKSQPNHPDYTGSAMVDGVEYWVSGWLKTGARGKWMSMAFQRKDARPGNNQDKPVRPAPKFDDLGDDIPF